MKKFFLLLLLPVICIAFLQADYIYVVNSESRTLSRIDTETGTVNNSFTQLGLTPNMLKVNSDFIYVVLSGANSIQMIDRNSGTTIRNIFIASSSNPWDVVEDNGYLYVSGMFTNKVYKISQESWTVIDQITVGTAPEGLEVCNGKLYVCNTGGYASGYANSSVSVIDLDSFSVIKTIPVWTNPQDIAVFGSQLHIVCTGNWNSISGAVDIIDSVTDERIDRLLIGGNPWSVWISPQGFAYLGEGYNSGVYSYNASTLEILHNSSNPLTPGGIMISGSTDCIAVLYAPYSQNGTVYLRNNNWQPITQWTVALIPTDICYYSNETPVSDEELPLPQITLYPNPVDKNGILNFKADNAFYGELKIYNLKGQKVLQVPVQKGEARIDLKGKGMGSGLYFYHSGKAKGKIIVK